jgi:GntR family transcriptional regulator, transcriptional repressor for pyruvate dehydrogenase complex
MALQGKSRQKRRRASVDWSGFAEDRGLVPIAERKMTDTLAARLEALIEQGRLEPGTRVPPERELAGMFNVSRAAMREALTQLALKGLIDRRPGRGTFVLDRSSDQERALTSNPWTSDIAHALDFRRVIEPAIAANAARRATRADVIRLGEAVRFMERDDTASGFAQLDRTFHDLIASACHNPLLVALSTLTAEWMATTRTVALQTQERRARSRRAHREIYRAIADGDPDAAEQAMAKHIGQVADLLTDTKRKAVKR